MRAFIALLILFPAFTSAQSELPDIDNMSIEEIENLPPEIQKELPVFPLMTKIFANTDMGTSPDLLRIMIGYFLRNLYYTPSVESEDAIRRAVLQFQHDIGAKATGELTMGQFEELNRRTIRRNDTPVYASNLARVHRIEGYAVTATGTWIIENDQIENPVNTAMVECYKNERTCKLVQASVIVPSLESSSDSYNLHLSTQSYEIISWTDNEVISRPSLTSACRSTNLTINTASNEVYEITRNNNQEECKFGDLFELPPLEEPRISRLVKGFDPTYAFWRKRGEASKEFMNSEIAERFQHLLGEQK